jgi:hypothetical protein
MTKRNFSENKIREFLLSFHENRTDVLWGKMLVLYFYTSGNNLVLRRRESLQIRMFAKIFRFGLFKSYVFPQIIMKNN